MASAALGIAISISVALFVVTPVCGSLSSRVLSGTRAAEHFNRSEVAKVLSQCGEMRSYAEVCRAVNCGWNPRVLQEVRHFNGSGSAAVVGKVGEECLVGFCGAANWGGVLYDVKSMALVPLPMCSGCMVGSGFLFGYNALAGGIKAALRDLGCSRVSVTGHSLGAAEAVVAVFDLHKSGFSIGTSYTFGQPHVGNAAFTAAFNAALGGAQMYQVVHGLDPIARAGPAGSIGHQGTQVFEIGVDARRDHFTYAGIYMTPCVENVEIEGITDVSR